MSIAAPIQSYVSAPSGAEYFAPAGAKLIERAVRSINISLLRSESPSPKRPPEVRHPLQVLRATSYRLLQDNLRNRVLASVR